LSDIKLRYYGKHRGSIKTGDIILFSGTGLVSWIIKKATRTEYTHVGYVLAVPEKDVICLFHSTAFGLFKWLKGPQMTFLSHELMARKGKAWVRHLRAPLTEEQTSVLWKCREYVGRPYETSIIDLLLTAMGWWRKKNTGDLAIYCSELVKMAFEKARMLFFKQEFHSPAAYSTSGKLELYSRFQGWGEEYMILNTNEKTNV
jgi:hypothetical protein